MKQHYSDTESRGLIPVDSIPPGECFCLRDGMTVYLLVDPAATRAIEKETGELKFRLGVALETGAVTRIRAGMLVRPVEFVFMTAPPRKPAWEEWRDEKERLGIGDNHADELEDEDETAVPQPPRFKAPRKAPPATLGRFDSGESGHDDE